MPIQAGVSVPVAAAITAEEVTALIAERDALAGALRVPLPVKEPLSDSKEPDPSSTRCTSG